MWKYVDSMVRVVRANFSYRLYRVMFSIKTLVIQLIIVGVDYCTKITFVTQLDCFELIVLYKAINFSFLKFPIFDLLGI